MNIIKGVNVSLIVIATTMLIGCTSNNPSNSPEVSPEGMKLELSNRSTVAYKKEGIDFSEYNKLLILPSQVAFKKNWQRDFNRSQTGLSNRASDEDVIRIKEKVSTLFDAVFKEEFGNDGGFPLVDKLSSGTLILKPAIINLSVNAPDLKSAGNVDTYTSEAGRATLFIELYDGVSGDILARVVNASVAGDHNYVSWANRTSNHVDAKRMMKKWAVSLKALFDEAHVKQDK